MMLWYESITGKGIEIVKVPYVGEISYLNGELKGFRFTTNEWIRNFTSFKELGKDSIYKDFFKIKFVNGEEVELKVWRGEAQS